MSASNLTYGFAELSGVTSESVVVREMVLSRADSTISPSA